MCHLLLGQMVGEEMVGEEMVLEKQVVGGGGQGAPGYRLSQGTWVQDSSSLELRRRRENTWTLSPFLFESSSIFCTPLEFCFLQSAYCSQTLLTLLSFNAWWCISLLSLPNFFAQTRHNPRRGNPNNVIFQETLEGRPYEEGFLHIIHTLDALDLQVSSGP